MPVTRLDLRFPRSLSLVGMARIIVVVVMTVGLVPISWAHQAANPNQAAKSKTQDSVQGFVSPAEFNVYIEADVRTLIVMAAVNMAGYDQAAGGVLTGPRAEIRKDLTNIDPELKRRLREFYQSKRRPGVDESADALRYEALSLLMT